MKRTASTALAVLLCATVAQVARAAAIPVQSSSKYGADAKLDHVPSLPGWGEVNEFNLFSGYVTVDAEAARALFYTFVESASNPEEDPLLLWSNGGPGCSSIGGGFMSELGPFLPLPGGLTLQKNKFAWNQFANVLFVDSPAFVGFSYSNSSEDRVVGDARTARDSRSFMLGFFKRFPHLKSKDFYLAGESYAGHYTPDLALEIVKGNAASQQSGDAEGVINLKGFLLGNPLTDTAIDNHGAIDFWWHHAIISDQTWAGIKKFCDFDTVGPLRGTDALGSIDPVMCNEFTSMASEEMGPINIYDIFADVCMPSRARAEIEQLAFFFQNHPAGLRFEAALQGSYAQRTTKPVPTASGASSSGTSSETSTETTAAGPNRKLMSGGHASGLHLDRLASVHTEVHDAEPKYDPCVDNEVAVYLNLPEVQKALHANQTYVLEGPWSDCTRQIMYSRDDLLSSMMPIYKELLDAPGPLRLMIYSGDVDGILPVVGTRRWVAALDRPETAPWRPWYSETQKVGGYTVEYDGITFTSIRNAGHMVPYTQPERMLHIVKKFLSSQEL